MKTFAIATVTAVTILGIAGLRAADESKPAPEPAPAGDTVDLTIVMVTGGGWGAAKAVRAALQPFEGVKTILLSGTRASVVMDEGKSLDAERVKAAVEGRKLKFVSLEEVSVPRPRAAYVLAVSGATWATKNEKARVALENVEGVATAFVNRDITLLFDHEDEPDQEALAKLLEPFKMQIKGMRKAEALPF